MKLSFRSVRSRFAAALVVAATVAAVAHPPSAAAAPGDAAQVSTAGLVHVRSPGPMAVSPDENWVWVASTRDKTVEVVDARTGSSTGRSVHVDEVTAFPFTSIVVSNDGFVAYAAVSNGVYRIDMHSQRATVVPATGGDTITGIATDSSTLFVSRLNLAGIAVDLASGTRTDLPIPGAFQISATTTRDGRTLFVRTLIPSGHHVMDTASRRIRTSLPAPAVSGAGPGTAAGATAVSSSGTTLYATGSRGEVTAVDTTTGVTTASIDLGNTAPHSVSAGPNDGAFYVGDGSDLRIVAGGVVTASVSASGQTLGTIGYSGKNYRLYAVDTTSNALVVFTFPSSSGILAPFGS